MVTRGRWGRLSAAVLCACLTGTGAAAAPDATADCATCHRSDGSGSGPVPRLAGLPQPYLLAQMRAFVDGSRADAVMTPIAKDLDGAATAQITAAYAAMSPPGTAPATAPAATAAGETLASRGAWDRQVPACAACHGQRGLGVGAAFPPLVGQPAAYLAAQLRAWKSGTRHDDPQGMMRSIAARLQEGEIDAVSAYYAGLTPGAIR